MRTQRLFAGVSLPFMPNAQDDPRLQAGATGAQAADVTAKAVGSGAWLGVFFILFALIEYDAFGVYRPTSQHKVAIGVRC